MPNNSLMRLILLLTGIELIPETTELIGSQLEQLQDLLIKDGVNVEDR